MASAGSPFRWKTHPRPGTFVAPATS